MGNKNPFYCDLQFLHNKVSGSCILATVRLTSGEKFHFLVDCGLFQELEFLEYNNKLFFSPETPDFILVTHSHIDHIGRLPLLVKRGYRNKIHTVEENRPLMITALKNSAGIIMLEAKNRKEKPLYREEHVSNMVPLIETHPYYETFKPHEHVEVTYIKNGHTLGATFIYVSIIDTTGQRMHLFFTGDFKMKNEFFDVPNIPDEILKLPLILITESTYGKRVTSDNNNSFVQDVYQSVNKQNKSILVLAASLQKTQNVLARINFMKQKNLIPKEMPIYLDSRLSTTYTKIFLDLGIKHDKMIPDNFEFIGIDRRDKILRDKKQKLIVTASGMGHAGPAVSYIPNCASRTNWDIKFASGYMAPSTLGNIMQTTTKGKEVNYHGIKFKNNADVSFYGGFSLHPQCDEILDFISKFKNLKLVLINHGEPESKKILESKINEECSCKDVKITSLSKAFRINAFGLVKEFNSKLS